MRTLEELRERLHALDGRGYPAYRELRGSYAMGAFVLAVDRVQGDPFAEPSRVRALVPASTARLPAWALATAARRTAAADLLNRRLAGALAAASGRRGSGRSGELRILEPGQEVLDRSSLRVSDTGAIEARFRAGLPARGRRILGREAASLLTRDIPKAIETLAFDALDEARLRACVETVEDARALRATLAREGLVAFVADGAVLPRRSGIDDRPLEDAVPFRSPASLRVTLQTPNAGPVTGMGVPAGVTLIVGGGFHGKSTLLRALERGVYDHPPGDGRERVVTVPAAVKVRAEDGRAVTNVDIAGFIGPLPGGVDTRAFSTTNASGSTSQAAAIVEALDAGATCLLLDEDTSATNFMIRDARMQALVPPEAEPITPFIDRARALCAEQGVSTVLVVGGSGDYFDVADTVIAMRAYVPAEVTAEARAIAVRHPTGRVAGGDPLEARRRRIVQPDSLDPRKGRKAVHVRTVSEERVLWGTEEIDLRAVEQLVEPAQARAIAEALVWAREDVFDGRRDLAACAQAIARVLQDDGLDAFQREPGGDLAAFRVFELVAFLGRIRGLVVSQR